MSVKREIKQLPIMNSKQDKKLMTRQFGGPQSSITASSVIEEINKKGKTKELGQKFFSFIAQGGLSDEAVFTLVMTYAPGFFDLDEEIDIDDCRDLLLSFFDNEFTL